ncbi:hypothetical protein NQD34_017874 [Periophthalmus magnuspinnatus]|nr:hypothetical protein NQD34_017874 [Periophthalmus magnuspinnatus]
MELQMLTCKRSTCDHHQDNEPWSKTRKCLPDRVVTQRVNFSDPNTPQDYSAKDLDEIGEFTQLISVWSDTRSIGRRVLLHHLSKETIEDILLNDSVNKKFLEFHRDITEECGAEDKQHSWAVIEKKEEVVMYGPYYPNYNKGKHSEDIIIRQTEELLESNVTCEDWTVYVFTMNSPCLSRNAEPPCMLKLVQKAKEWWLRFGVNTNIGYNKCWGFKGTKETIFRGVNYSQVEAVHKSENYEEYISQKLTGVNILCKNVYTLLRNLLKCGPFIFDLSLQGLEWKSYFKGMLTIPENAQENEKEFLKRETSRMTEEVKSLSTETCMSAGEHSKRGQAFALDYKFDLQITTGTKEKMRLVFQKCWKEMVQDKYAEILRDILTEDFNKCTNQLFIKDFVQVTSSFLHIGRIDCTDEKQQVT